MSEHTTEKAQANLLAAFFGAVEAARDERRVICPACGRQNYRPKPGRDGVHVLCARLRTPPAGGDDRG